MIKFVKIAEEADLAGFFGADIEFSMPDEINLDELFSEFKCFCLAMGYQQGNIDNLTE